MSIAAWLTQTGYVATADSIDAFGKPVYGVAVAVKMRVEQQRRMVLSTRGEEAMSTHRVWSLTPINLTDRVWLPGEDSSLAASSQVPLSVSAVPDKSGSRTLYRVDL